MYDKNFELGGGGPESIGAFIQSGCAGFVDFGAEMWVLTSRMEWALSRFHHRFAQWLTGGADKISGGGEFGISSAGGGNGGSGIQGYQCLHHNEAEYGCTIYFDATDYVPL